MGAVGGEVLIRAASGLTGAGGAVSIEAGEGAGVSAGGAVSIEAGASVGGTGSGGSLSLQGGEGMSGTSAGGSVSIEGGSSVGGSGGSLLLANAADGGLRASFMLQRAVRPN